MTKIDPVSTVVGVTGHRQRDFSMTDASWAQGELFRVLQQLQRESNASVLATGCAIGTDLWAASKGIGLGLLHVPYLPFQAERQSSTWNAGQVRLYNRVLAQSWTPQVFGELPEPGDAKATRTAMLQGFHDRNRAIVEASDVLVAVWTGRTHGGTAHAITEAVLADVPIVCIHLRHRRTFIPGREALSLKLNVTLPVAA